MNFALIVFGDVMTLVCPHGCPEMYIKVDDSKEGMDDEDEG